MKISNFENTEKDENGNEWTTVVCDCGSQCDEITPPRSMPIYICFNCFNFTTKKGKFYMNLD